MPSIRIKKIALHFVAGMWFFSCFQAHPDYKVKSCSDTILSVIQFKDDCFVKIKNLRRDSIFFICLVDSGEKNLLPGSVDAYVSSGDSLKMIYNELPDYGGNTAIVGLAPGDSITLKTEFSKSREIKYYGLKYTVYTSSKLTEFYVCEALYLNR
jgi:hypothetical protein